MDEPTGLCKGCWRTIDEIVAWSSASDAVKQQVWVQIAQRKASVSQGSAAKTQPNAPVKTQHNV
jgi:uncharacterized protein